MGGLLAAALALGATGCGAEPAPTESAAPLRIETPAATLASFPRIAETMTGPWQRTYAALHAELPQTPFGALVVARSDRPDASLEIVAEDDAAVRVTVSQGWTVHAAARPSTDVFYAIGSQRAEEIRILADRSAATTTSYRVKLGPSIARVRVQGHRFEALDDEGRVLLESEPVWAQDHRGVVRDGVLTAELVGPRTARLTVTFDTAGLTFPVAIDPAWRATGLHQGSMSGAAAAQLDSGNVVTLTKQTTSGLPHAQLYDAVAGEWRIAGTPALPRNFASALRIGPTRAMFAGGGSYVGSTLTALRTVEIYDESANTWTTVAGMAIARSGPLLLPLPGNKVLALGGNTGPGHISTSEIYDPSADVWSPGPSATAVHSSADPVVLADGRWLMVDGKKSEVFDPVKTTWTPISPPPFSIDVTQGMTDGRVLAVGTTKRVAIYDPKTDTWTNAAPTTVDHSYTSSLSLLASGRLLLAGGRDDAFAAVSAAELFDPTTGKWTDLQAMPQRRHSHFAFRLPKGTVLVFGGSNDGIGEPSNPILFRLEAGLGCTKDDECSSGYCTDGVCCDTRCRGACEVCDRPTAKGTCGPSDAAPKEGHGTCEPFARCTAGKCLDKCTADTDCAAPGVCFTPTGKCTSKAATCDGAHTVTFAGGGTKDCSPYTCAPTGDCNVRCASSSDCVSADRRASEELPAWHLPPPQPSRAAARRVAPLRVRCPASRRWWGSSASSDVATSGAGEDHSPSVVGWAASFASVSTSTSSDTTDRCNQSKSGMVTLKFHRCIRRGWW